MRNTKGQTILEYVLIIIIVLGAFIAMSTYIKRGIQGRWKVSVDDLGDQYEPSLTNLFINHTMVSNANTLITTSTTTGGILTLRVDNSLSTETKSGFIDVDAE